MGRTSINTGFCPSFCNSVILCKTGVLLVGKYVNWEKKKGRTCSGRIGICGRSIPPKYPKRLSRSSRSMKAGGHGLTFQKSPWNGTPLLSAVGKRRKTVILLQTDAWDAGNAWMPVRSTASSPERFPSALSRSTASVAETARPSVRQGL